MNDTEQKQPAPTRTARQTRCLRAIITLCAIHEPVARTEGFSPSDVWGGVNVCKELVELGWLEDRTIPSDVTEDHHWFAPAEALEAIIRDLGDKWDSLVDGVMARKKS